MSSIVLVVHFCVVLNHSPFLKDCSAQVFPKKSMAACEESKTSWLKDPGYKRYFSAERKQIADGERAIVAAPHCEVDPEADFSPVSLDGIKSKKM